MKKMIKRKIHHGLPLYYPFKLMLERRGIDSATAGQTSWLFVSLLISLLPGIILSIVTIFLDSYHDLLRHYDDFIVIKTIFYALVFHFFIVMFRLKYLFVNVIFTMILALGYVIIDISNIPLLVCMGLAFFIIYMLIPIYSWRIKILDTILYSLYAIVAWVLVMR